jgi:hypothetical protein
LESALILCEEMVSDHLLKIFQHRTIPGNLNAS